jgi:tetratricopeptide (TPR) repeat protein
MAADIHALEIEFAKNPTLEACIPLCEAYMGQKRFMEAMVVCKKGIKQAPQDARGRVLLARVYSAQGKAPKAQAELDQLLVEMPGNPLGLEAMGKLLLEQGRRDEGLGMLQKAAMADPSRAEARAILQQAGIALAVAPAPQAAPVQMPPQMAPPQRPGPQSFAPPQPGRPQGGFAPPQPAFGAPQGFAPQGFAPPQPGRPGQPPPAMPSPFQAPPQGPPPTAGGAAVAPAPEAQRMEHVHDFFAPETLGFSNDSGDIETAGPGRLTILGFVPKSTASIKTTLFIVLAVLAVAGGVIFWQYRSSITTREINKKYGELKAGMDEDKYGRYQDALKRGTEILAIDDGHNLTLGALAYIEAILAVDFKQPDHLARAKDFLARAMKSSKEETEFRVAARALIAYADRNFDQGLADIKKIIDRGGSSPFVELEAFRLMAEAKPNDKGTQTELRRLTQAVTSQARALNFLGWYYYGLDDYALADKNFAAALQNVRGHPRALVGQALTDFDRGLGLQERQKEIGKSITTVLSLPAEDLDPEVLALAHFAAAQLQQWQGKQSEADVEFDKAFKLQPGSALMFYRRGTGLLNLGRASEAVDFLRKAAGAAPNNVRYYRSLASAQIKTGDVAGAKATLDRASQLAPNDPTLKVLEGDRLRADKKFQQAIDTYKLVKKDDGGPIFADAAIGIGKALRESGKKKEAIKQLEDFLAGVPGDVMQPQQAELWCELGLSYEADKDKEKAQGMYEQGVATFPYYAPCHYYSCRLGRGDDPKEECRRYVATAPRGEFAEDAKKRAGIK